MEFIDQIWTGNSLERLKELPDECAQVVGTSPPYFNMRAYDGDPQIFDAARECEHEWEKAQGFGTKTGKQGSTEVDKHPALVKSMKKPEPGMFCVHCGAFYGFLGLEPSPELYIKHLVDLFREVRRVLRTDGTLWLNIADSYWGGKGKSGYELPHEAEERRAKGETFQRAHNVPGYMDMRPSDGKHPNIKPKDLIGIPYMLVMALRDDGWWWRSTVIWRKINCMPSSAKDRPTTDFEYIYFLAKNGAKPSFWTHRAGYGTRTKPKADYCWLDKRTGLEQNTEPEGDWRTETFVDAKVHGIEEAYKLGEEQPTQRRTILCTLRRWKRFNLWRGHAYYYNGDAIREPAVRPGDIQTFGGQKGVNYTPDRNDPNYRGGKEQWGRTIQSGLNGRNKRAIWESEDDDLPRGFLEVNTKGFPGAHFAVFPEKLVEPMILAGSSDTACPECGAAWLPRKEKTGEFQRRWGTGNQDGSPYGGQSSVQAVYEDKGLQPTCGCENNDGSGASLVLDPFIGSGTTAMVAKKKGRHWLGIDASEKYAEMARKRVSEAEVDVDPDANQLKMF